MPTPEERAAAVREALAKHAPPTAEEVRALRQRLGIPEDSGAVDPSAGLAQFAATISGGKAAA